MQNVNAPVDPSVHETLDNLAGLAFDSLVSAQKTLSSLRGEPKCSGVSSENGRTPQTVQEKLQAISTALVDLRNATLEINTIVG